MKRADMRRGLFGRRDWPVLLAIALGAVIWLALANTGQRGVTAVVERDGQVVLTRELDRLDQQEGPELVEIEGANSVTLTVELSKEGARIAEANCPDRTCQRTGRLTRAGESAVCLPGRIVLRLEGPETGRELDAKSDAETY